MFENKNVQQPDETKDEQIEKRFCTFLNKILSFCAHVQKRQNIEK